MRFGTLCALKLGGSVGVGHAHPHKFLEKNSYLDVISCNLGHVFKEDFHFYFGVKFSEKYSLKVNHDVLSQI